MSSSALCNGTLAMHSTLSPVLHEWHEHTSLETRKGARYSLSGRGLIMLRIELITSFLVSCLISIGAAPFCPVS